MDMRPADVAWYLGFMLGTSAIFWTLGMLGIESWWAKMLVAAPSGIGIGWVASQAVQRRNG